MKHYEVCTPQYWTYVGSYSLEPPEWGADCVSVEAANKRDAKVVAVRELRKQRSDWMLDRASDKASPFTGLVIFDPVCAHGVCQCAIDHQECDACLKESEAYYEAELARTNAI